MATLKIYNDIQREQDKAVARMWGDVEGTSFADIDSFCNAIPEGDNQIDIRLHCDGGSVTEGWAIYDRLRATGKEITATAEGNCASMATIILMAAPKERRRAYENAHICVHNPWMCPWALGDAVTADDLQKYANDLRSEQDRMVDLYVERCGCSREEIQALMDEDKYIDAERALSLGIVGEIAMPMSAKKINPTNKIMNNEKSVEVKASVLDKILAKLGLKSIEDFKDEELKGMDLNTADGNTIRVEREDGEPQVGDVASPDGEWLMPDGTTIVVQEGVIAEIRPKQEDAPEDEEARDEEKGDPDTTEELDERDEEEQRLRDRIAELEKENEELRQRLEDSEKNAKTEDDVRILDIIQKAGGEKALAMIKNSHKPEGRQPEGKQVEKRAASITSADIIAAYEKKNKKK